MKLLQAFYSSRNERCLLRRRRFNSHLASILFCFFLLLSSYYLCDGRLSGKGHSDLSVDFVGYPKGDFRPLKCNDRLYEDPCVTPWSKVFGDRFVFPETVEIPCGKCIVLYPSKNSLTLAGGLIILGKLVIHANDILTTSILVHGELVIESLKPIDGLPDVSITWVNNPSNETLSFQVPETEEGSISVCGGKHSACAMGRKPFVVAGGRVDIRGLPLPTMPTWVPVYDVDTSGSVSSVVSIPTALQGMYQYQPPKLGCPEDEILIHHNSMISSISDAFRGSYGSYSEWIPNGGLKLSNRTHSQHCPIVDLKHIRHCLQANKIYLLTAKVMLTQDGKLDQSDCARGESDATCMSIYQLRMSGRGIGRTTSLWKETKSFGSMIGEETTIAIDFNFTSQQIDESNIYEIIQLRGPSPGVDMELLEFTLRAPPKEAFLQPEHLCMDLIPSNGDAELLGLSPYPFRSNNDNIHISVVSEGSNHYFEVTGRGFDGRKRGNWRNAGITWDIIPSCMKAHTKYVFHADIRMHSLSPISLEWKVRAHSTGTKKMIVKTLADCLKSQGTWVTCDGYFEPSEDIIGADRLEVFLESDTSSYDIDYDVDNILFKLTESGPDQLILPNSIENLWNVGSEILITSHTSKWDGHSIRRISSMESHDKEGYVRIGLNEQIDRPLTLGSSPFHATEVALLSRNIRFDGANGAHLTILKTPHQTQIVQGVEFLRFGEESVENSYPVHFDSCSDSSNSIVSRNTIRESNQRCVVLDETDHVLVEENVAFSNKGHCFVVGSGKEVGNLFMSNLGAFCQRSQTVPATSDYNEKETDDTPAVFWIGGPSNHWIGNIASGSEGFGFWFQPKIIHDDGTQQTSSIESPHLKPLHEFTNNIVHSTKEVSLKFTGYNPTQRASIKSFKSYLVTEDHFQVTDSSNIYAFETLLDSLLTTSPFPMSDTTIIPVYGEEETFIEISETFIENSKQDVHNHQSVSNPINVFNLQSSPSLFE